MNNGLLLYTKNDAKVNKWFIEHLINVSKTKGIELSFSELNKDLFINSTNFNQYNFCINRTRFSAVNNILESNNIRCYNNSRTVTVANDKWLTFSLCKELGIPTADTLILNNVETIDFEYPFIIKSRNGHGGSEVFWINKKNDLNKFVFANESGYVVQKPVSNLGVDVRIYVLGNQVITGVKRTSSIDFRSNFSLGGQVELFSPTKDQLDIIDKLQKNITADYVGFDFILHKGEWILNEIEDVVGARMLYSLCNIDIGEKFIDYISCNNKTG